VTTVSKFDQSYIPTTALTLHTQPDCVLLGIGPLEDSVINSPTHSLSLWNRDLFDNIRPTVSDVISSLFWKHYIHCCIRHIPPFIVTLSHTNPINTITIILPPKLIQGGSSQKVFRLKMCMHLTVLWYRLHTPRSGQQKRKHTSRNYKVFRCHIRFIMYVQNEYYQYSLIFINDWTINYPIAICVFDI